MDVTHRSKSIYFIHCLVFSILLSGCLNKSKKSAVSKFDKPASHCTDQVKKGNFVVQWASGAITIEKGSDRESFIENFIEPNNDFIERVEHNLDFKIQSPTSSLCESQGADNWGISATQATSAWAQNDFGQNVLVAVIDSGIDLTHPQLKNRVFVNPGEQGLDENGNDRATNGIDDDNNGYVDDISGYSFADDSPLVTASGNHGTHVSGIILAEHNDISIQNNKVQGVAPGATLLPLPFIDGFAGDSGHAILAIDYAIMMKADIINASWGGSGCSTILQNKIQEASDKDILFVSAAGNSGRNLDTSPEYPAAFNLKNQITVGATGRFGHMASFTNYSTNNVHIFAPGADIESTTPENSTTCLDGTSMAAPFVSGAAALIMSKRPDLSASAVKQILMNSVHPDSSLLSISKGSLNIKGALQNL